MASQDHEGDAAGGMNGPSVSAYRPVTLGDIRSSDRKSVAGLLAAWGVSIIASVILGVIAIQGAWSGLPFGFGGVDVFISLYPPLTICMLWTLWFGFWWGAIPAYAATFVLALYSGLHIGWAFLFAFSNPLGLAVFALSYRAIALPYDARSLNGMVFFVILAFIGSVFGATGSFVWTLTNEMGIRDVYAIWQGWWLGNTLQKSFIVLPILMLFTPLVVRWRDRVFLKSLKAEVSRERILLTVGVLGVGVFLFLGLSFYLSELTAATFIHAAPPDWRAANDVIAQSAYAVYWIMGGLFFSVSYLGYRFFTGWTEALEKSAQAATKANQAKSDFLARMSHELRTPINGVIGMAQLMERTKLTAKQRSYLEKTITSAHLLTGVIDDILDFSKIEAGRLELETTRFDLDEVLKNLSHVIALKAEQKGIELLFRVDDRVPRGLRGDPLRLGQVLINLSNNAIKFTEHGQVAVNVTVVRDEGPSVILKFSVEDTGIGLSEKEAGSLFQPFTQADESITRRYGGTGLGLAISRQLVELMGGRIEVNSSPSKGSCFSFSIPLEVARPRRTAALTNVLGGKRVLVVDDSEAARSILVSMLTRFGFVVETAASGAEALLMLEDTSAGPFNLVVLDWKMPGAIDGIGVAETLKNRNGPPWPPKVLLVTGYGRDLSHFAINRYVDGYLVKPVCESLLLDTVMDLFAPSGPEIRERAESIYMPPDALRGARILVVEDNDINRQIVTEFLEDVGVSIETACSGKDAIAKVSAQRFDAILMDLQMPDMDGIKATRLIKQNGAHQDTPIIALTAHAFASVKEDCRQAGMVDHLVKPIDSRQLYDTLVYWIERDGQGDAVAAARHPSIRIAKELQDIPSLPGIDISAGIRRLGHKKERYVSTATDFLELYDNAADELRNAYKEGNTEFIFFTVHSMGPLARYVGADQLAETLAELETAARHGGDDLEDLLFDAISALNTVRISLKSVIRNGEAPLQS